MNKNHVGVIKRLSIIIVSILGLIGIVSINRVDGSAVTGNKGDYGQAVPVHTYAYKIGDMREVTASIENNDRIAKNQRELTNKRLAEVEAERVAKEEAEKKALEEQAVVHSETASNENNTSEEKSVKKVENKAVQTAKSTASASTSNNSKKQSPPAKPVESKPTPAPQPKPAAKPAPKPEPKKAAIGSNKIGMNGSYKSYSNYGLASTATLQAGIDSGLIVAGLNTFNGSDGATTYFGGHNPGIMNFLAKSIRIGGVITVTDSNGTAFNYKMIDKVDVDEYGEGVLKSIGMSAIEAYMFGTGSESILIQFCNTNNTLMSFWYGVKV